MCVHKYRKTSINFSLYQLDELIERFKRAFNVFDIVLTHQLNNLTNFFRRKCVHKTGMQAVNV